MPKRRKTFHFIILYRIIHKNADFINEKYIRIVCKIDKGDFPKEQSFF